VGIKKCDASDAGTIYKYLSAKVLGRRPNLFARVKSDRRTATYLRADSQRPVNRRHLSAAREVTFIALAFAHRRSELSFVSPMLLHFHLHAADSRFQH
jgi:hypothetical protein